VIRGLPPDHPALAPALRGMKLWCETGRHAEPRTVRCDRCGRRTCPRHSRWDTPPRPARARRVCDDCARKEARR
jgi:hypothetical protein